MIVKFKLFENKSNINCFGLFVTESELIDYYEKIKKLNIKHTFYNAEYGLVLYIYTSDYLKKKYFSDFFYQPTGDTYSTSEYKEESLDEYIVQLNANKYNL